jgi:LmbE family N-acetylglucosaminyl deacetylase
VTTFDGQVRGTSEQDWAACEWLRDAPELDAPAQAQLVVLAAHPDDETLGAGGLIGLASAKGFDVYVIFASDGAASHPNSSTHSPARLAALRKDEAVDAVRSLAPDVTLEFLELPDGELAASSAMIRAALRAACWDETLLVAPWAYDRHPDHEACAQAARAVAAEQPRIELLEFPIWAWHWGEPAQELTDFDPEATAARRLTLSGDLQLQKQAAIACYRSQTGPLSDAPGDEALLTPTSLAYFARECECFFVIEPSGVWPSGV